jgi:uncharacterized Fe-S cluster-containing radical SAM superfamily protein
MNAVIRTAEVSEKLRARALDVAGKRVLISRLGGSDQEGDLQLPANCDGYGRVRHFKQKTSAGWPANPLPIVPACTALGLEVPDAMTAQVFQNAACAWRCWYCFVPYNLLGADLKRSEWFTAEQLVALYQKEADPPRVIDLSGGSPDLVPEWTVWMMEALEDAGIAASTYLWTDDNLSTRYLFDKLDAAQLQRLTRYRNYGRVCCFKGFDAASFRFNTTAAEDAFDAQFDIMQRMLALGLDIYGYITLTGPDKADIPGKIDALFDRLQALDPNLPLRIIPLEIRPFAPMEERMTPEREASLAVQAAAIDAWNANIVHRFAAELRRAPISHVPLRTRDGAMHGG